MNSSHRLAAVALALFAADAHASQFLGRDRAVHEAASPGSFDQVKFRLNMVDGLFGPQVNLGSATLSPADIGTSIPMEPSSDFAAGIALLTDGRESLIETLLQSPGGSGSSFSGPESTNIELAPSSCWSGTDFQGATIDRIEFYVAEFTLIPSGRFTSYRLGVEIHFFGTPPGAPAGEVVRLGTPPNPQALLPGATSGPVLGQTWDPVIDHAAFVPNAVADFLAIGTTATDIASPIGTLLCGASPALIVPATPGEPFAVPMPATCSSVGFELCAQGASLDPLGGIQLTNALDATIGSY